MGTGFVTLEHSVGRLVECRSRGELTLEIAQDIPGRLRALFEPLGAPALVVADARNTEPFTDEVAQRILRTIVEEMNPRMERAGILVGGRPLFEVQIESILIATHHPRERTFRDVEGLIAFLSETATGEERRRMAAFFANWIETPQSALRQMGR